MEIEKIKEMHDNFRRAMMKKGKLPMFSTLKGFYSASNPDEVYKAFEKINLSGYDHFLDMGSGDGIVVLIASLFTKATGVEFERSLYERSVQFKNTLGLENAEFENKDFFEHDISSHDLVFISPDKPMYRGLDKKFSKELKGHLLHTGTQFHPSSLSKLKQFNVNGTWFTLYGR